MYNGIVLNHKKEWNDAICSSMDGPRDDHTEWSKSDQERQIPYDTTNNVNVKYDMTYSWNKNELTYETETNSKK